MKNKELEILEEQLKENNSSLFLGSIATFIVIFAGNSMVKTFNIPSLLVILIVYVAPWIVALPVVSSIIKDIKIKRAMKKLK
ncbi:hypothetical protein [Bacillus cereus group sp. Bce029]|uniref:hypothetical protein n=1 Tax=Bacillus cereus group sp. Bce029 TaxID=3445239 RepID=UPI004042ED25